MTYHHGNARSALVLAAAELLETEGAARLSLRQVAERAGLSRQAPYNHFADKEALLAELVRDGFLRLAAAQLRDADKDASPVERLAHAAGRYIAFGQGEPALFRLMFSKELVDIAKYPATQEAASSALAGLTEIIAGLALPTEVDHARLVAWSLVHGYTTLCVEIALEEAAMRSGRALLFAQTIAALCGHAGQPASQSHQRARATAFDDGLT